MLRLAQIAPIWCNVLSKWPKLNAHQREAIRYDLRLHTRCIMAEIYGWTDDYTKDRPKYCSECDWYGNSFMFIINGPDATLDKELLERKDKEFCAHFMKEHLHITPIHDGLFTVGDVKRKKTKKR